MDRSNSNRLHLEAENHLVGGVNSPVRAFKSVHGSPVYFQKASGAIVTDVDGNELVDFIQSWGPLIHGHANSQIIDAVALKMQDGTSFGAPHMGELELAKKVKLRFPFMDKVRFVSSGTEAVMSTVRLARGYTGRDLIIKFEGCYHGHVDSLMVNSGSGLATFGIASSPGIPKDTVATTLVAPLDDEEILEHLFSQHGSEIAAAVIEPLPANNGLLVQRKEFLSKLRELCTANGALLIFDEVISGFRFEEGGYGGYVGIEPDITALGKVIGGGLPVGAYGAKSEIMNKLSPLGPVYQAGTLSGNPLAMAAGSETLDMLSADSYQLLESLGSTLENATNEVLAKHNFPMRIVRLGSLFWFSPGDGEPPNRADQIPKNAGVMFAKIHQGLLERGYMLAPSAYEIGFISTAHQEHHVLGMVSALDDVLENLE